MKHSGPAFRCLIVLLLINAVSVAAAATVSWDGGGDGERWSDPLNWSGNALPQSTDDIVINAVVGLLRVDQDFTLDPGGSLTLGPLFGEVIFIFPSIFQIEPGITLRNETITLNLDNGLVINLGTIAGTVSTNTSARMSVGGFFSNDGLVTDNSIELGQDAVLENIDLISTGAVIGAAGSQINNRGAMNNVAIFLSGAAATLDNNNQILMDTRGIIAVESSLAVVNNNGTITNRRGIRNAGTFNNIGTLNNNASFVNNCNTSSLSVGTFNNTGTLTGNTPITTECKTWDNDSGNGRWSEPANWNDDQLPARGDQIVINTINDTFTFVRLDIDFRIEDKLILGNLVTLDVGSTSTLTNQGELTIRSGSLFNEGTFVNGDTIIVRTAGAGTGNITNLNVFSNNNGASIDYQNSGSFVNGASFQNSGTVQMSCNVSFTNNGSITGNPVRGLCSIWDGGGDGERWSDPLNWSQNAVPGSTDDIVIDSVVGLLRVDQDFTLDFGGNLTLGPAFGEPIFIFPSFFQIEPGITLRNETSTLNLDNGVVINLGTITGTVSTNTSARMSVGGFFSNDGLITDNTVDLGQDAVFENIDLMSDAGIVGRAGSRINNRGAMNNVAIFLSGAAATLDNNNQILMDSGGVIALESSLAIVNNNATITNNREIRNAGTFNNFGTLNTSGGNFENGGTFLSGCDSVLNGAINGNQPVIEQCDTTPPVISVPADITREATSSSGATVSYSVTATDNVDGAISPGCVPASGSVFTLGSTTVNCSATDAAGNTGTSSFTVEIVDTTAPVISAPADVQTEASAPLTAVALGSADASDFFLAEVSNDAPAAFPPGDTVVTWTATDSSGNSASATQSVTVSDTTPPAISLPPDRVVEGEGALTVVAIGTATAQDLVDGVTPVTNDAPAAFPVGTTIVTWTATDTRGNTATGIQSVTVVDTTPPVLLIPDDIVAEATAPLTLIELGTAAALDIVDGVVLPTNDAPVAGFPVGTTNVTWTASDAAGNSSVMVQVVTVTDTTPPELVIPPDMEIEATAVLSEVDIGLASAVDLVDGNVEVTNDAPDAGYPLGTTIVTWQTTDSRGNATSATQEIIVVDTTPPELQLPADVTVIAAGLATMVDIGIATATDIFTPVEVSNDAPLAYPIGITDVTWEAIDANGNRATETQRVHVQYLFEGFLPPLRSDGVYKSGRTVPLKFVIAFSDGTIPGGAVASFQLFQLVAGEVAGEPLLTDGTGIEDEENIFRFTGSHYQFNFKSSGVAGGLYRLIVSLDDGTQHFIDIAFK